METTVPLPRSRRLIGSIGFSSADIHDLPRLAERLRAPGQFDDVSRYIGGRLSPPTRGLLSSYRGGNAPDLAVALADDLNRIICTGPIYEEAGLRGVSGLLSPATRRLLNRHPQGKPLTRLNRMLLADVYPNELAKPPLLAVSMFTRPTPPKPFERELPPVRTPATGWRNLAVPRRAAALWIRAVSTTTVAPVVLAGGALFALLCFGIVPVLPLVVTAVSVAALAPLFSWFVKSMGIVPLGRAALVLTLSISAGVILAFYLSWDTYASTVLNRAINALAPFLAGAFGAAVVLGVMSVTILEAVGRRVGQTSERREQLLWTGYSWFSGIAIGGLLAAGAASAAAVLLESAPAQHVPIAHADFIGIELPLEIAAAGGLDLPERHAVVAGANSVFALAEDNVIVLDEQRGRQQVFADPLPDLSDMAVIEGYWHGRSYEMVLIVAGHMLARSDGLGTLVKIADLPLEGLRFGQRVCDYGAAQEILLYGRTDDGGVVFGLRSNGEYLKIAELDVPITAAAQFCNHTVIAAGDKLLTFTPGEAPTVLFEMPPGFGTIISVVACAPGADAEILFLTATKDAVFAVERGHAYLVVAGLGGELRTAHSPGSPESTCRKVWLTDGTRNAVVKLTLQPS